MRFSYLLIACGVFILYATACTVQKRHYRKGYFVQGPQKKKASNPPSNHICLTQIKPELFEKKTHTAFITPFQASSPDVLASTNKTFFLWKNSVDSVHCDSLYLKDGSVIAAKVTEINIKDVRYKLCDFMDGPDYLVEKFRVSAIRFSNGKLEEFNEPPPPVLQKKPLPGDASITKGTEKNSNAGMALSWGILGIYPIWIIGSIIGLIFGIIAMNQIKMNPGKYSNETSAKVGLGLSAGALVAWIVLIFIAFTL